jgi:hypothetical protein
MNESFPGPRTAKRLASNYSFGALNSPEIKPPEPKKVMIEA